MSKRREGGGPVEVRVLRVFCAEDGRGGNELGVVVAGAAVAADDRQALASHLGYSETVFVDDPTSGRIAIYTPATELPFAGHPVVGTAWLLAREGYPSERLLTPAGAVWLRHEGGLTWARGEAAWCPPFELIELDSAEEVDRREPARSGWQYVWAWIDEAAGSVRSRCFVAEAGITEDEATGSAALLLCDRLGRDLEVRQGRGSLIHTRQLDGGGVEIGGTVVVV